jgi:YVTN family beta-propeller protein
VPRRTDAPERLLTTVLFTDIVGSTQLASELGDRAWRQLLSRHHGYVRKLLKKYGGREVDTAGDGFFATFDQPARAINCAKELVEGLHRMGIEIRAGVHMGEVEVVGPKVSGIAVHIGSRVMSKAGPGEVLVSSTVRDLMSGSEIKFDDRGLQELKGVPAQWHLFRVETDLAERPAEEAHAPEGEEGRRRLPAVLVAAGVAVALIAGIVVVVVTRGGGGAAAFKPAPNTVVRIDPASGKIVGGTAVGTQPQYVAFDQSSGVWVANFGARTVQRIDPETTTAGPAFGGLNGNPTGMAVGGGFTWVTSSFQGSLSKIDPATNLTQPVDIGDGWGAVAFGEGSVWVANFNKGTVLRIDPTTSSQQAIELPAGSAPSGIAVGGGSVWVADKLGSKILRIDASTNKLIGTGTPILGGHPEQVAFGAGFVWITNTDSDSVTRIDPKSAEGVTVEHVGNGPRGIAAGSEGVWVANSLDGTVAQIDPSTAKVVKSIKIGFDPEGVAVGAGAVWVTVQTA